MLWGKVITPAFPAKKEKKNRYGNYNRKNPKKFVMEMLHEREGEKSREHHWVCVIRINTIDFLSK